MRRILPRIASQNQTGHWSLYPPVSIPHWLRVVPTGSNSITRLQGAASPTQRFQWQKFWRGLNETEVRCCHHEVSLSLHRTAISCSCNQKWTKGTWHWTLEVSAILAKEFSQFLYKVLGSISFSLVSVAAVGLSSGDEAYVTFILNQPPNFETLFFLNFIMYFPIPLTAFFSEFLFHLPIVKFSDSWSLHTFCLFFVHYTISLNYLIYSSISSLRDDSQIFISSPDLSLDFLIQIYHPVINILTQLSSYKQSNLTC